MDTHVRYFAITTILLSAFAILVGISVLVYYGVWGLFDQGDSSNLGPVIAILIFYNLVLAVPSIVSARFLLQFRDWARSALIIISALNILNLPFGSLLAMYGFWVLMSPETEPLFTDPLPHIKAQAALRADATAERKQKASPVIHSKADLQP